VKGNGFAFTNAAGGVRFDIRDVGVAEHIAWPEPGSDDAFLALDRNGDGVINSGAELFGNATEQPASAKFANGYNALSVFDENGDGVIDERDAVYSRLLLWQDANHDGVSQPEELHGLAEMGVAALSVQYTVSKKTDRFGNQFHYRANVYGTPGSHVGRYSYDVFPAVDGMDIGDDGAVDIDRELEKITRVAGEDTGSFQQSLLSPPAPAAGCAYRPRECQQSNVHAPYYEEHTPASVYSLGYEDNEILICNNNDPNNYPKRWPRCQRCEVDAIQQYDPPTCLWACIGWQQAVVTYGCLVASDCWANWTCNPGYATTCSSIF